MKTCGPVLCVEDLRLAAHQRLPLSASASKKKEARMAEKTEATWRESEANGWGKEQAGGEGVGRGGGSIRTSAARSTSDQHTDRNDCMRRSESIHRPNLHAPP